MGGAARAVKKNPLCREGFLFFIISIQIIGNGALLAEKVPCTEAMSRGSLD